MRASKLARISQDGAERTLHREAVASREALGAGVPRHWNLDRDALAALRAARIDHRSTARRLHAHPESVRFLSMRDRRLESAFHGKKPLSNLLDAKHEIIADRAIPRHF